MPARKIPLDPEMLTDLYVKKRLPIRVIGRTFGAAGGGTSSVLRTLRQLGITRPEPKPSECKMSQLRELQALYARGQTMKEAGKRFGFSASYVSKLLRESGTLTRRAGRPNSVVCKIPGCINLVQLITQHGVLTGTMCRLHRLQYQAERARISWRRKRNLTPDQFRNSKWQHGQQLGRHTNG
jgi:hypothetical protein